MQSAIRFVETSLAVLSLLCSTVGQNSWSGETMKGSVLLALLLVGLAGDLASGTEKKEHGSAHTDKDGEHNEAHDAESMLGETSVYALVV